jgi:multiple sugar transport system substrate-binding protein
MLSNRVRVISAAVAISLLSVAGAVRAQSPSESAPPVSSPAMTAAESPAGTTAAESPAATAAGESPAAPGASETTAPTPTPPPPSFASLSPDSSVSGDLFAYGVTYTTADEIGFVRIDYFKALYPNVNLTVSESDFDPQGFLSAMQTDQPPDVVRIDRNYMGTYVANGTLAPIDDCLAKHNVDMSKYYDAAMSQVKIGGKVYGVPEFYNTRNWDINTKAFSDAGLDPNTFDFSNWDAIKDASSKMYKADGGTISRLGIDPKVPEFLPMWVHANGSKILSDDGLTANFTDPKVAEALKFAVDLINAQGGSSAFLDFRNTWDFFGGNNEFAADQVGAFPMEQWYLNVLLGGASDPSSFPLAVKPFLARDGSPLTYADGTALAVTTKARNPDAACAFVTSVASTEAWVAASQYRKDLYASQGKANTGTFTADKQANDQIFHQVLDISQIPAPFGPAVQTVLDNQEHAFALPPTPAAADIFLGNNSLMSEAVARALNGEDINTVLQDIQSRAQDAIDQAKSGS